MDESLLDFISILLIVVGMAGTILPVLPGMILSFASLLLYKFASVNTLPMLYIYIFGALTIISSILNYTIPARQTRKYGGTRWGSIGSVVGTFIGLFFIPVPFGFLIGMILGVFAGELLHDRNDINKALKSAKGSFFGFLYSTVFSFMVTAAMLLVVVYDAWIK